MSQSRNKSRNYLEESIYRESLCFKDIYDSFFENYAFLSSFLWWIALGAISWSYACIFYYCWWSTFFNEHEFHSIMSKEGTICFKTRTCPFCFYFIVQWTTLFKYKIWVTSQLSSTELATGYTGEPCNICQEFQPLYTEDHKFVLNFLYLLALLNWKFLDSTIYLDNVPRAPMIFLVYVL